MKKLPLKEHDCYRLNTIITIYNLKTILMDWFEMQEKHKQQFEDFKKQKQAAWNEYSQQLTDIKKSYTGPDGKLPRSIAALVAENYSAYMNTWGFKGSVLAKLKEEQQTERDRYVRIQQALSFLSNKKERSKSKAKSGCELEL